MLSRQKFLDHMPPAPFVAMHNKLYFEPQSWTYQGLSFWIIHLLVEDLQCPGCNSSLKSQAFPNDPPIADEEDFLSIMAYRYNRSNEHCEIKPILGHDERIIRNLPTFGGSRVSCFPATSSHRSGLSNYLIMSMRSFFFILEHDKARFLELSWENITCDMIA